MRTIYLDYAAATPLDKRVFAVMEPFYTEKFYNPSSAYQPAREVRRDVDDAKHRLAMVMGGRLSEIILTAGATESINLAIAGTVNRHGGTVVTTAIEHPAVLESARAYGGVIVDVTSKGMVDPEAVRRAITDETTIVSVGYVNSELGTVQPIKAIAALLETIRAERRERGIVRPLYFHTDASQAPGYLDISVARLGVDLMTLNASKCYGPKQVGLLWVASHVVLASFIHGGGQERGLRSGTENVPGVIGFARALEITDKNRKREGHRIARLRDRLERTLLEAVPDLVVNGSTKKRLPNHLHISLPGLDGERALFALDARGVLIATGSACAANKGTRSHVLTAVGMSDELADGSLRITLGHPTSDEEVDEAACHIIDVLMAERGR